jgi:iron(III) transport system substrate-binding protein
VTGSRRRSLLVATVAAAVALPVLAGCGGDDGPKVVVYNAQHEELIDEVADAFEDETGIEVQLRNGKDLELANQLVAEGDASPADVFLTENSPAMRVVDAEGLFAELDQATLDRIPAQYRPADGHWTGFAARTTALVYNTAAVKPEDLPTSILDLAEPEWKGRITFSPTGADFQAIVAAVLAIEGEPATKTWLEGLKANRGFDSSNNLVVMKAVNDGQADIGIFYHYYWYRDQAEAKENSANTQLLVLGDQDPGAFLSTSGAGVLENGDHPKEAQQFVDFLTSAEGQQVIADSYALEYTLNPDAPLTGAVKPLAELEPPDVSTDDLDADAVIELMQSTGLL